jgi:hypothetical protein
MQADKREDELGFNHKLLLVDKQKGSADRKSDRQAKVENAQTGLLKKKMTAACCAIERTVLTERGRG